ncbi:MAG: hypothetical protein JNM70_16270 [Anaerolineae bacterium]|nr:hypothetical protein [Anaerolineae bacterium]
MKHKRVWITLAALALLILAVALPLTAHEDRESGDGKYSIVLGWRVEPAYTTLFNGPEFTVKPHGEDGHDDSAGHDDNKAEHADDGIAGLEETLQIEVSYGGQSKLLRLRPVPNSPGHYTADLIPTQPGDYTFRVFGTIESVEIDETFSSAEGEFSTVEPISDIQFP